MINTTNTLNFKKLRNTSEYILFECITTYYINDTK